MSFTGKCVSIIVLLVAILLFYRIKVLFDPPKIPQVDDIWWGPKNAEQADSSIRPFKINVPNAVSDFY